MKQKKKEMFKAILKLKRTFQDVITVIEIFKKKKKMWFVRIGGCFKHVDIKKIVLRKSKKNCIADLEAIENFMEKGKKINKIWVNIFHCLDKGLL